MLISDYPSSVVDGNRARQLIHAANQQGEASLSALHMIQHPGQAAIAALAHHLRTASSHCVALRVPPRSAVPKPLHPRDQTDAVPDAWVCVVNCRVIQRLALQAVCVCVCVCMFVPMCANEMAFSCVA